jgi:DNA ligase 1
MRFSEIARTWSDVAGTSSRLEKVARLSDCLRAVRGDETTAAVSYLSGELPQGTIGVGWALMRDLPPPSTGPPTLEVADVDAVLTRISALVGSGSQTARRRELVALFERATEPERRFLLHLLSGELRQGALRGVMVEAVAKAAGVPAPEVRRALMLTGDAGRVAELAFTEGSAGLAHLRLQVLQPLEPMLAKTAANLEEALARITPAYLEWKLDGARLQVHRLGNEVRAFTRTLADISYRVPEVVDTIRALPLEAAVLDGEVIALRDDGRPLPFQQTMSRFGSRLGVDRLRADVPLSLFLFDCLHIDGIDLIDEQASVRFATLSERLPHLVVPRMLVEEAGKAKGFLEEALRRGHEGVMVKAPSSTYEAGRRGGSWLKVKRALTLDLVVLAAEWGHGRRRGWLSNLHLGARAAEGGFVMLGKTFKGMTDEMLAWQTERLLQLESERDGITVHVRPELVVEVAFDGFQKSTRYQGGVALRFARIKGYRHDKLPEDADTMDTVRALAE